MTNTKPNKEELLQTISVCQGIHDVAQYYNVSYGTIRSWMRWNNINLCPDKQTLYDDCLHLTDKEIAKKYKVTDKSVNEWKKTYGISKKQIRKEKYPSFFTNEQDEIITGILLGDAWLSNPNNHGNLNSHLGVEHGLNQEEYLLDLNKILKPFSNDVYYKTRNNPFKTAAHHKEKLQCCGFKTAQLEIFTKLRNKWYDRNKKIVPRDIKLSWRTLAFWFLDDGCNLLGERCVRNHGVFCTNSFSVDDVQILINQIRKKNIDCSFYFNYNQPIIKLHKSTFCYFIKNISPYIKYECLQYKLQLRIESMKGKKN